MRRRPGAVLAEQVGQQLVMAMALPRCARRRPVWIRRGQVVGAGPGAGGGRPAAVACLEWCWPAAALRRAGGACSAAAAQLMEVNEAPARRRAGGVGGQQLVMAMAGAALCAPGVVLASGGVTFGN